jgi:hypothetical protein
MGRNLVFYYWRNECPLRRWEEDHVFCWKRYAPGETVYCNLAFPVSIGLLRAVSADTVILHATALSLRYQLSGYQRLLDIIGATCKSNTRVIAMPLDEFRDIDRLDECLAFSGAQLVYTTVRQENWSLYYKLTPHERLRNCLTSYVDEALLSDCVSLNVERQHRPIDVMYRAWEAEAWLGKFGALKVEVGEFTRRWARQHARPHDFGTAGNAQIRGNAWLKALSQSKATVGVEGGSSILDFCGDIRLYQQQSLDNSLEAEVTLARLLASDGRHGVHSAMSPRNIEAALTKTLQILVEGLYSGVLSINEHYIPLAPDFTNLNESLALIDLEEHCNKIVDAAFGAVTSTEAYRWRNFVKFAFSEAF